MIDIEELDVETIKEQYRLCTKLIEIDALGRLRENSWIRRRLSIGAEVVKVLHHEGYQNIVFGSDEEKQNINLFFNLSDIEQFADKTATIDGSVCKKLAQAEMTLAGIVGNMESPFDTDAISYDLNRYASIDNEGESIEVVGPTSKQIKTAKKLLKKDSKKAEKFNKAKRQKNAKKSSSGNSKTKKMLIKIAGGTIAVGTLIGGVLVAVRGIDGCKKKEKELPVEWNTGDENSSDEIPYVNPAEERENESFTSFEEEREFADSKKETQTSSENGRDLSSIINTNPQGKEEQTEIESEKKNVESESEKSNEKDPFENIFGDAEPEM